MVHNLTFDPILHLKSIVVLLHFYLKRKLFPYSISMALCDSSPQDVSSFQKKKKLNNVGNFFFFMKKKRKVISQNIFYPQKTVTQFQNRVMVRIFIFGWTIILDKNWQTLPYSPLRFKHFWRALHVVVESDSYLHQSFNLCSQFDGIFSGAV